MAVTQGMLPSPQGAHTRSLSGLRLLITAGPTIEDLDPVRFISNRSSGRMGIALARRAAARGAAVLLIHGPLSVAVPRVPRLAAEPVRSAREMYDAVLKVAGGADAAILCAAVADFTPARVRRHKIKKGGRKLLLELVPTPDILAALGRLRRKPFLVGFAAETRNVIARARAKLRRKNCDLICANDVTARGSGFGSRTNRVTLIRRDGAVRPLPLMAKNRVADVILDEVRKALVESRPGATSRLPKPARRSTIGLRRLVAPR